MQSVQTVRFRLLGALEARSGTGPAIDLGPPKQRALLAVLLLHAGEIVSIDRLMEALWPDHTPRTAQHSIQIYVSNLRKALRDSARIETRPPGYLVELPDDAIDVRRFELWAAEGRRRVGDGALDEGAAALRKGLDEWRGDALADFRYEEFAQAEIRRLEGIRLGAREDLAVAELELGRPQEAASLADRVLVHDPFREKARQVLMLGLYRTGRRAEALRTHDRYRRHLATELGLEPSPELDRLEEQILMQDPSLGEMASAGPVGGSRNPFKGLRPFGEGDAADFFGRSSLVERLLTMVGSGHLLLAIVGPSGSGKSSLVAAGLIPRLRAGVIPGSSEWAIVRMVPGRDPLDQLTGSLRAAGVPIERLSPSFPMADHLAPRERLVLVVDQFEEVFLLPDERETRSFLDLVSAAAADPSGRVVVVLTLRADFYDRPLAHPGFAPVFVDGVVNLTPMSPAELEASVVEPAHRSGFDVDHALLAELAAEMLDAPGSLPLMQYVLTEMVARCRGQELDLDLYRQVGGLRGALTGRAEDLFGQLTEESRRLARQIFLRLVSVSGPQVVRRRTPVRELLLLGADPGELQAVLDRFAGERLLTFDRDPLARQATVELAHEALIDEWPRLSDWVETHRSDLGRRQALLAALDDWEAAGRHPDYLLRGDRLADFEEWAAVTPLKMTSGERAYLDASADLRRSEAEKEAESRRREAMLLRRARWRLWGAAAAVALLAATLTFGFLALRPEPPPDVALVLFGDGSGGINAQLLSGLARAEEESGVTTEAVVSPSQSSVLKAIETLSDRGAGIVILGGANFQLDAAQLAAEHEDIRYVVLDPREGLPQLPNLQVVRFAHGEGSFLAGAAAALRSETGRVGFVGGVDIPLIWEFQAGFEAGVRWVSPDSGIVVTYLSPIVDGFGSPTLGAIAAERIYDDGVDVVFHAAGDSGFGVFEAAANHELEAGDEVWAIGVDQDQYREIDRLVENGLEPALAAAWKENVLTSMVKRYDAAVFATIGDIVARGFTPGEHVLALSDGAVDYATSGGFIDPFVPELERLRTRLIAGEIDIPEWPENRGRMLWPGRQRDEGPGLPPVLDQ